MKNLNTLTLRITTLLLLTVIALLWAGTSAKAQPGTLDLSFNPGIGANGLIEEMVLQPDGKTIIGGQFTTVNSIAHRGIARLNADGTLDATFAGTGVDAAVNALALQSDGKVLFGGWCHSYNGSSISNIARANTDGSIDASFVTGSGANNNVMVIVVQPDGKILIGGYFSNYGGTARTHIARLNANGSLDASFNPTTGPNSGGYVRSIAVQPDGKILIGGDFTTYNGTSRNRIARLNADGSLDATFNPGTGADSRVNFCTLQTDGKIMIGGNFSTYNGTGRNYIARLNVDGSLDAAFNPGTGANSSVQTCTIQSDGKIIIGGYFVTYNGTGRNRIARLNANGSLDAAFNPGTGANSNVETCAIQSDGKIMISGNFTAYNGTTRNRVARVLAADVIITWTGTTSTDWNTNTNWSSGTVPLATDNVSIPNVTNDPVVSGTFTINNVDLASGATLTVASGGSLELDGALTNAGAITIQNGGSFLQGNSSSIAGAGTFSVQRLGTTSSTEYNLWSTPVAGGTLPGTNGYQYISANGTNNNSDDNPGPDPGWSTFSGTMTAGRGYASNGGNLASFTGTPGNDIINIPVTYYGLSSTSTSPNSDFVLLGNPYPSGLTVNTFLTNNSARIQGQVWAWDDDASGGTLYTSSDYSSRTTGGAISGGNGTSISAQIASCQGFMVKAISTGTVAFNNAQRDAAAGTFLKTEEETSRIWLSLANDTLYNEVNIVFMQGATTAFDNLLDGHKLRGNPNIAFAVKPEGITAIEDELCIAALPPVTTETVVALTAFVANEGVYTIRNKAAENFTTLDVYLEDRLTGNFTNLTNNGEYSTLMNVQNTTNRFFLHFAPQATGIAEHTAPPFVAYTNGNELVVLVSLSVTSSVVEKLTLTDMTGKTILTQKPANSSSNIYRVNLPDLSAGMYVVSLQTINNTYSSKIIVK